MKDLKALKEFILSKVQLRDLLIADEHIIGLESEEQMSCPFHGVDVKKSARYYPSSDSFYCWVCRKSWDLFSYLMDRHGLGFNETVKHILLEYRLDISSVPDAIEVLHENNFNEQKKAQICGRSKYVIQLRSTLLRLRPTLDPMKYGALVYSYMVLKNMASDEKFPEYAEKMNAALIRITKKDNDA